jgi:hypothetical protein
MIDVHALLQKRVDLWGSQMLAASQLGISQTYLNHVLTRKRKPGPKILKALGLKAVVTYKPRRRNGSTQEK